MKIWPSVIVQSRKHPLQFLQEEPAAAAAGVVEQQKELLCQEDYQGVIMAQK